MIHPIELKIASMNGTATATRAMCDLHPNPRPLIYVAQSYYQKAINSDTAKQMMSYPDERTTVVVNLGKCGRVN